MNIKEIKKTPKFPLIVDSDNGDTVAYYFNQVGEFTPFMMPSEFTLIRQTSEGVITQAQYKLVSEVKTPGKQSTGLSNN